MRLEFIIAEVRLKVTYAIIFVQIGETCTSFGIKAVLRFSADALVANQTWTLLPIRLSLKKRIIFVYLITWCTLERLN